MSTNTPLGSLSLNAAVTDAQGRRVTPTIALTVLLPGGPFFPATFLPVSEANAPGSLPLAAGGQMAPLYYSTNDAAVVGIAALVLTAAWAYAFTRIYTRPVTRVAATDWIYQNVPGPINLKIARPDGTTYQQPLPFPAGAEIDGAGPYIQAFTANAGVATGTDDDQTIQANRAAAGRRVRQYRMMSSKGF